MTNEELALLAQNGDKESLLKLWENTRLICMKCANKFFPLCALVGMEKEDLEQELYIGFHDAVKRYDESRNTKFSTLLYYCIKTHCTRVLDIRNGKKIKPYPLSLDHNYSNDYEGEGTLGDTIGIDDAFDGVEKEIFNEQLKSVLMESIEQLSPQKVKILFLRYQCDLTFQEIGNRMNVTNQAVSYTHRKTVRKMSRDKKLMEFARCM